MTAILKITDGTDQVDLLGLREGVSIQDWRQAIAEYKAGGTWQQSSLSDGRRLVDKRFANTQEIIPIQAIGQNGNTQDVTIAILHRLFALMEKASDYWVNKWRDEPVWLERRARCATNTEYAVIHTARIPQVADLFAPGAFDTSNVLDGMLQLIERGHWTETRPGTGTAVELSAVEAYDGRNLGNVDDSGVRDPTTANEVFVASRRNMANLTDVYTWSAANGFSANLMDAALPFDLIDSVGVAPQVNDYVIFGIDSVLANSGEFASLVFDIGTAAAGLSFVWETWQGGPWLALIAAEFQDNTDTGGQPLDTTGVNSVIFANATTSSLVVVNGVNAHWIRLRITAVGAVTIPTQQNRDTYSVVWPYTELAAAQVGGNLPARAKLKLYSQTDETGTGLSDLNALRKVVVGLRSLSRGSDFTAYLNCADEQNPANVTVAITGATGFASNTHSPTGRVVSRTTAGAVAMSSQFTITLAAPLTADYYGQFRGFLRMLVLTGVGEFTVQVVTTVSSGGSSTTSPQTTVSTAVLQAADLGTIEMPLSPLMQSEIVDEIVFDIQISYTGAGDVIQFMDLILIPVDEWACDTFDFVLSTDSNAETDERLLIDSIGYPKSLLRTHIENVSTGRIKTSWAAVKNGPAILQRNANQRLWFAIFGIESSVLTWQSFYVMSVQVDRQQRYLGPRGDQ